MKTLLSVITILALLPACASAPSSNPSQHSDTGWTLAGVLYQQTAGEYRALCYQAYNWAHRVLEEDLRKHGKKGKAPAVIVDIDETILDNSPYQATLIRTDGSFGGKSWSEWVKAAQAEPVPGSVEFLNYAAKKGAHVFYITNRSESDSAGTLANLKKMGFPITADSDLIPKTADSSKESRRQAVRKNYRVVLLMGDNLADFSSIFDRKTVAERKAAVDEMRLKWGVEYIALPNAMYGDWEAALYDYNFKLSPRERENLRLKALKSFSQE